MFNEFHDFFKCIFKHLGFPPNWIEDVEFWIFVYPTIFSFFAAILRFLYKKHKSKIAQKKQNFLNKDLHGKYTANDVFKATKYNIPTKFQFESPSSRPERDEKPALNEIVKRYTLNEVFINDYLVDKIDSSKYYMIFAAAGMGKSVSMINLYLAYKKNKAKYFIKYNIELFPLGDKNTLSAIKELPNKSSTILLLDAFDEDPIAVKNYNGRFVEILNIVKSFRKIIVTCRTEFFPSSKEEPFRTGEFTYGIDQDEYVFKKIYISPFDEKDIKSYLFKIFNWWSPFEIKNYFRARAIIKKSKDLMIRPMLLYYVKNLVNEPKDKYTYQYQIYDILINEWIAKESSKSLIKKKYNILEFKQLLYKISLSLAVDMYDKWEERGGLYINKQHVLPIDMTILDEISNPNSKKIGESEWRNYSLLIRDGEGNYRFAHRSILEFLLAKEAFQDKQLYLKVKGDRLNVVRKFIQEIVFVSILKTSDGNYRPKTKNSLISEEEIKLPLNLLNIKNINNIELIKITLNQTFKLHCITSTLPQDIKKIALSHNKLRILYFIYIIMFKSAFTLNSSNSFFVDTFNVGRLKKIFEYFGLWALQRRIDYLTDFRVRNLFNELGISANGFLEEAKKNELIDYSFRKMLTWYHEFVLKFEKIDGKDLTITLESKYPIVFENLKEIDSFIKECEYIQQEFKEANVLY